MYWTWKSFFANLLDAVKATITGKSRGGEKHEKKTEKNVQKRKSKDFQKNIQTPNQK